MKSKLKNNNEVFWDGRFWCKTCLNSKNNPNCRGLCELLQKFMNYMFIRIHNFDTIIFERIN